MTTKQKAALAAVLFALPAAKMTAGLVAHSGAGPELALAAGTVGATAAVAGIVESRRSPLDLTISALVHLQAVCLAIREELGAAIRSAKAEHADRVRRIRERHSGERRPS